MEARITQLIPGGEPAGKSVTMRGDRTSLDSMFRRYDVASTSAHDDTEAGQREPIELCANSPIPAAGEGRRVAVFRVSSSVR